jgi:eukaryotic-like serine/threonine-protein kinase
VRIAPVHVRGWRGRHRHGVGVILVTENSGNPHGRGCIERRAVMVSRTQHRSVRPHPGVAARRVVPKAVDRDGGVVLAGRYRLVELIGRGASASVWRARDELMGQDVTVKQLRDRHPHSLDEARITARIRHPNVTAVHDVVHHRGTHCLVMDYRGGVTLAELLVGGHRLPPSTVAAIGLRLLAALRAVHEAGVVHCDVKPANVLIDDDGVPALIDFGIAETVGADPAHPARRTGDLIGSPAYMAPELVRGEAPQPAADLWSFGATLYAAVEGRPPFAHDDVVPTLTAVLHDRPAPARRAGRLRPLLARLLVKDPAERPCHDAIHALLSDAYPGAPVLVPRHRHTGSRAADPAGPTAVRGPAARPSTTLPWNDLPSPLPSTA